MIKNSKLELKDVSKHFGGILALDNVSLVLRPGEISILSGPNGAGKSTIFNIICGVVRSDKGQVHYGDRLLSSLSADAIARLGIGRLFQDPHLFAKMSVLENVLVAGERGVLESPLTALVWPLAGAEKDKANKTRALNFIDLVGLSDHKSKLAGELSGGQKKRLAIARLLNNNVDCFLLDEPTVGLNQEGIEQMGLVLKKLTETGKVVAVIEHNLAAVRPISDVIFHLEQGRIDSIESKGKKTFVNLNSDKRAAQEQAPVNP